MTKYYNIDIETNKEMILMENNKLNEYLLKNFRGEEIEKEIRTFFDFIGEDCIDYKGRQILRINFLSDDSVYYDVHEEYFDPETKEWVETPSEYSDEDIFATFFQK